MADPLTAGIAAATEGVAVASTIEKHARQAQQLVGLDSGPPKRLGTGGEVEKELSCKDFITYVNWEKTVKTEKKVIVFPNASAHKASEFMSAVTLGDIRDAFLSREGVETPASSNNHRIADVDGYDLAATLPAAYFSQQCRLSLRFTEKRLEAYKDTVQSTVKDFLGSTWPGRRSAPLGAT
ncbi:unnamed protein product [Amoebophrya sp. A25]|nr:unnamed protein product [Amoebophrya sp. A25]|eukprot:GSA25T00011913001.1